MNDGIYTDSKLIFADLTYKVRGAIFEVYNTLGSGHKEQVYQKALEKELEVRKISYKLPWLKAQGFLLQAFNRFTTNFHVSLKPCFAFIGRTKVRGFGKAVIRKRKI